MLIKNCQMIWFVIFFVGIFATYEELKWDAQDYNGISFLELFDAVEEGNHEKFQNLLFQALPVEIKYSPEEKRERIMHIFTKSSIPKRNKRRLPHTLLNQALELFPAERQIKFLETILSTAHDHGVFESSHLTAKFFVPYYTYGPFERKRNFLQKVIQQENSASLQFILNFMFKNALSSHMMSQIFDDGLVFLEAFRSNNIKILEILLTTPVLHLSEKPGQKTETLFNLLTTGQKMPLISSLYESDSETFLFFLNFTFQYLDELEQSKLFKQMFFSDFDGEKLLHKIAREPPKDVKNLALLIEKSFPNTQDTEFLNLIEQQNNDGQTALHVAIGGDIYHNEETFQLFLEFLLKPFQNANDKYQKLSEFLFIQDDKGETVLHSAIRNGYVKRFLWLLENAFEKCEEKKKILFEWIFTQDKNGDNILFAAMSQESASFSNPVSQSLCDIVFASGEEKFKIQKLLETQNNVGNSFLHVATCPALLEWFFDEYTATMKDVQNKEISIENLLSLKNHKGETALHTILKKARKSKDLSAILANSFGIEENIWKRKLNKIHFLMIRDNEGKNVLDIANPSQLEILIPWFFSNPEIEEENGVDYDRSDSVLVENPLSDESLKKLYKFYGKHFNSYNGFTNFKNYFLNSNDVHQIKLKSHYMSKVLLRDFLFLLSQTNSSGQDYDRWISLVVLNPNFQQNVISKLESQILKFILLNIRHDVRQPFLNKYPQISL